jgi:hypothetical protein
MLAAGGITWTNTVLLSDQPVSDIFTESMRMALVTGVAAGFLYGVEQLSEDLATAIAWAALVTVLLVRVKKDTPTVTERVIDMLDVNKGWVKQP